MSLCACGGIMEVGAGWCQKCWASWSTWFMRAGGTWIALEARARVQCQTRCQADRGVPCDACRQQHMLQELVDECDPAIRR